MNIEWFNIWQNVIHIQCWQVHDDALLRSRGTTVDIGYAARETEPDWPLIRHNILHVIIKYAINFFLQKRLVENPQLATAKWKNQKNGKPMRCTYRIAATATFKGSESANPSCLRWYLLNFCSCCKAASTDLVQSAAIRVLNSNRSLAKQACFLSPEPFTAKVFWQWAQFSTSLRLHPPGFLTCLL